MKKIFAFFAVIMMAGTMVWAEEPETISENNPDPVFQLRMENLNQSISLLNYEPSFQLNESNSFGFDSYNDFSSLTRRKKNKTAKILTFVGAGCIVVGGTVAVICAVQMVKSGTKGMEDIANDIDNLDSEDDMENFNNDMEGFNKTTDNMLGYWIGAAAGGVVATAGGVLTTIGIIKWVRGSHRRHSELFNGGVDSDLCANPQAMESSLSFGVGNGTVGFALEW